MVVLCNFQAEMKGQLFSHLSNVSNCSNLEAAIGKYSRFFFYFQNLSFSFSTIWRNDRKVLYNFQAEMKQRAIILPSFELEQFGACYREISAILPTRFGERTKMAEKYFIIFRQRWNKRQWFFHFSNVSNRSNLKPAIGKCFLYFSSPFYTVYRMENDRKVLDNFQACAEMKHGTSSWYAIGRLSSGSCTPSLAREKSSRWFTMPLERVCFSWPTSSRVGPRSIIRRSTEIV